MGREVTEPSSTVLWVPNTQRCRGLGGSLRHFLEACCPALHIQKVPTVDDKEVLGESLFRVVLFSDRKHRVVHNRRFGGRCSRELWRCRTRFGCLNVLLSDSRHSHLEHIRRIRVLCEMKEKATKTKSQKHTHRNNEEERNNKNKPGRMASS